VDHEYYVMQGDLVLLEVVSCLCGVAVAADRLPVGPGEFISVLPTTRISGWERVFGRVTLTTLIASVGSYRQCAGVGKSVLSLASQCACIAGNLDV